MNYTARFHLLTSMMELPRFVPLRNLTIARWGDGGALFPLVPDWDDVLLTLQGASQRIRLRVSSQKQGLRNTMAAA